ncbi:efflux RND transporter periplasmic adaptor subunit [Ramlibacter sp.]|uniref:efflux RND transporter periplasmic adaptor subunit n=1 Tax=Ramlibacter sp. TaxID=1917967 RepID=UPI00185CC110|nr:efflux RND transporter periplasmic adaptor subunit [Ramlibacter sp.]MBA2672276.1 efflux RND transporter periplasmic adaptor subunit [Ramlibacter sp.]
MKRRWVAALAIAVVVVIPVAATLLRGNEAKDVQVERAQWRELTPSILTSGTLAYESQVTLGSETIGRVDAVFVKEGDIVKKGQLLLRLDAETPRSEIVQLQAGRDQAMLNVDRQRVNRDSMGAKARRYEALRQHGLIEATKFDELVTQRDVAEVELRASREAVKQAEAQLQQSRQKLAKTEIRSPMDGKVTSVTIKVGETAVPSAMSIAGSSLMTISDTRNTFAEVSVDEADIARIEIGREAKIVPAAFPDRALRGRVDRVAMAPREVSGKSRSYAVKIRLDPSELAFHPGMSCRAEIAFAKTGGAKSIGVPLQAVQYDESERSKSDKAIAAVFVLADGKAVRREVDVGVADDAYIEVLKGLQKDELVIVGPPKTLRFLRGGEAVKAQAGAATGERKAPSPL